MARNCCENLSPQARCGFCLFVIGIFLVVLLVPLSFSYVEYYEYGLLQRKTTSNVDTTKVYGHGRYFVGPDYRFIKYPADAHVERLDDLSVFSAGASNQSIGLEFKIDVDYTYLLIKEEIGMVHVELASTYRDVITSRTKDAIKNEAIFVSFDQYFQERKAVEARFREAVQKRWDAPPRLHCTLDQFNLGRIQIPDSVAVKQLEAKIQNERNDRESFLQQASVERELTKVENNTINLEQAKVLRTAQAEANLLRAKARVEADQVQADAQTNGTERLMLAADIRTQEHLTAFTYIRTLTNHKNVDIDLTYLSDNNVIKTRPV